MKKYKLKAADMETLTPISVSMNPRGGANIQIFRESGVATLAAQVHPASQAQIASSSNQSAESDVYELAPKNGKKILRTKAMKLYKLTPSQIDSINPVSVLPNPHGKGTMRHYNLCDVEALAEQVPRRGTRMSDNTNTSSQNHEDDDDVILVEAREKLNLPSFDIIDLT